MPEVQLYGDISPLHGKFFAEYCQLVLLIYAKFLLTGKIGGELFRLKNHSKWIELAILLKFSLDKR